MNDIKNLYKRIDNIHDRAWVAYKTNGDSYLEGRADAFQECLWEIEKMYHDIDFSEQDHD